MRLDIQPAVVAELHAPDACPYFSSRYAVLSKPAIVGAAPRLAAP